MAETTRKTATKTGAKTVAKPATKAVAAKPATAAAKATTKTAKPSTATTARKTTAPAKTGSPSTGRKTVKTVVSATAVVISDEQRYKMIAEAAYYRAESSQFQSDPVRDWIEAEKDIAALLNGHNAN